MSKVLSNNNAQRRKELLRQAEQCVCTDRNLTYGDAEDNFTSIAKYWSVYLGVPVTALDVGSLMILFKLARTQNIPTHQDSWVDLIGYATCAAGIVLKPVISTTGLLHQEPPGPSSPGSSGTTNPFLNTPGSTGLWGHGSMLNQDPRLLPTK